VEVVGIAAPTKAEGGGHLMGHCVVHAVPSENR